MYLTNFRMLSKMPPFPDCRDDGREIVVQQYHRRGFPRDVRAPAAHGDPDIRTLECRRIVDSVAGHGNELAARLQCLDQRDLLFGRHPGVNTDALGQGYQLLLSGL